MNFSPFDIRLERISMVQMGKYFLKQIYIKKKLKDSIIRILKENNKATYSLKKMEIFHLIVSSIDNVILPKTMKEELVAILIEMITRTLNWLIIIGKKLLINENEDLAKISLIIDNLFWEYTGYVDEARTIRSVYYNTKIKHSDAMWILVSDLCLKDCYNDLSKNEESVWSYPKVIPYSLHFLVYWQHRHNFEKLCEILLAHDQKYIYEDTYSIAEMMLRLSLETQNYTAFKYFWYKIKSLPKHRKISFISRNFIRNYDIILFLKYHDHFDGESFSVAYKWKKYGRIISDISSQLSDFELK